MTLPLFNKDNQYISQRGLTYHQKKELYEREFGFLPEKITNRYKLFLAGFFEGEGSITLNVRTGAKQQSLRVDAEFNVTQKVTGITHLLAFFILFHTGRIKFKNQSEATYVYFIQNRQSLQEKVVPFYERFVLPYACESKSESFQAWKKAIRLLNEGRHRDRTSLRNEILPLVYQVNTQSGREKRFPTLEDAQNFCDSLP